MYNLKPQITFKPTVSEFKEKRLNESNFTALSGSNNSGKTYFLKVLRRSFDASAVYIPCQRFVNQGEFNTRTKKESYYQDRDRNTRSRLENEAQNEDSGDINLNDILFNLKNRNRKKLMELSSDLLGETFSLKQSEADNDWSSRYVQVGSYNLSYSSTGTRLLLAILGMLLDESYKIVLIDEPEIGLTPSIQNQLAKTFTDSEIRQKYFPHIQHVFIATHSHIFLDHKIKNNFIVTKTSDNLIELNQVGTINEFHKLQFNLLGNTFESMFLPSAIIIVEGNTDRKYIKAVVSLKFPERKISFQEMFGGNVGKMVSIVDNFSGGLQQSPFGISVVNFETLVYVTSYRNFYPGISRYRY